jgi:hypothetical protein
MYVKVKGGQDGLPSFYPPFVECITFEPSSGTYTHRDLIQLLELLQTLVPYSVIECSHRYLIEYIDKLLSYVLTAREHGRVTS